jgi:Protein of unknown function with HXXEE motif
MYSRPCDVVYGVTLWAIVVASALHVGEEYFYPGGFLKAMRAVAPRFAAAATPRFAILVNGMFLVLVVAAAAIGAGSVLFSLSIAALVGVNGLAHCLASLRARRYVPGTITGAAAYLPLCVTAYVFAVCDEDLTLATGMAAGAFGVGWNATPPLYLLIRSQRRADVSRPS